MTLDERFFSKVHMTSECWEWTAAKHRTGYGKFGIAGSAGGWVPAHRVAYEQMVGPIPEGLQLDHLCRNRACVRPDHLEPVTHRTNSLRGVGAPALNARKTHCPAGHPYDEDNTYENRWGRKCRKCHDAEYWRQYRAKRKAEGRPLP